MADMIFDSLDVEILPDGRIKWVTDSVSRANHDSAETFLRAVAQQAGGTTTRTARKDVTHHHHAGKVKITSKV